MSFEYSSLCDVAEVVDSLHKTPIYVDVGHPMVRVTDVKYGELQLAGTLKVSNEVYNEFSRRYKPSIDDIIITRVGSYGITSRVVDTNFCLGQNTAAIIPRSINARYLYAVLNSPFLRDQINAEAVGSTQKTLSLKCINALKIPRMNVQVESQVAEIVGALDDRISLLRETNSTLESIAQALFKSWFVDFDPVHANAGAQAPSLPPEIQKLFPSTFVESPLGLVPEGWDVDQCQNLIDVRDGTHASPKESETGFPLITSKHITSGKIRFDDAYLISEVDYVDISRRSAVHHLDVLITMIGTVGIPVFVLNEVTDFAIKNIGLFKTSKRPEFSCFIYLLLKSKDMQNLLESRLAGTTQKYLSLKALREIPLVVPSADVLGKFEEVASSIFKCIHTNNIQVESLISLRDTLLPRLISGQLRLPEVE